MGRLFPPHTRVEEIKLWTLSDATLPVRIHLTELQHWATIVFQGAAKSTTVGKPTKHLLYSYGLRQIHLDRTNLNGLIISIIIFL